MISSYGYYHLYTPKGIYVNPSPNITDGSTTRQLSIPSGKNFIPGTIEDTTDSPSTIDLESGQFTELEYSLFGVALQDGETYEFRISDGGKDLTTYTVIPQWIVGAEGGSNTYQDTLTSIVEVYAEVPSIANYIDSANVLVSLEISEADTITMTEALLSNISASNVITDVKAQIEAALTTLESVTSVQDAASLLNSLLTGITAITSVTDSIS